MIRSTASTASTGRAAGRLRLLGCAVAALLLAGCNTMEGIGRDAQAAGKALEDAARNAAD